MLLGSVGYLIGWGVWLEHVVGLRSWRIWAFLSLLRRGLRPLANGLLIYCVLRLGRRLRKGLTERIC